MINRLMRISHLSRWRISRLIISLFLISSITNQAEINSQVYRMILEYAALLVSRNEQNKR